MDSKTWTFLREQPQALRLEALVWICTDRNEDRSVVPFCLLLRALSWFP